MTWEDHWDKMDSLLVAWAVLDSEGTSPSPCAIFPDRHEADDWLEDKQADPDNRAAQWCVLPVVNLSGDLWNCHDALPAELPPDHKDILRKVRVAVWGLEEDDHAGLRAVLAMIDAELAK